MDDDALRKRLSELKQRREECLRLIAVNTRRTDAPAAVLSAASIDAFGRAIRDRLANPSIGFRKAYLRLYVARVELDDSEVRIFGPKDRLVEGIENPPTGEKAPVPSFMREWRPREESNLRPAV